ncbi:MAG: laccase domain-containing protein, partial [Thermacetogeniaceae bacterium]
MDFVLKNELGQLPYLYLPGFGEGKVRAVFTTRRGGVSRGCYSSLNLGYHTGDDADAVTANRRLVTDALNIGEDRLITLNQVHSDRVVVLEREEDLQLKKGSRGDGLITHLSNVAISILCADCQAIYLYDP